jgi:GT2 family glycosyltransferase
MTPELKLSIIIVSYNTKDLLIQCLSSVLKTPSDLDFEIIVVDNCSKDGSVEEVQKNFPQVKLIINQVNVGFAKANNQAIVNTAGEYFLLLNSDTKALPGALDLMVDYMGQNRKVGALGCKLLNEDFSLQGSCRHFPTLLVLSFQLYGLNALFPRSRLFGRYPMSYWDHNQIRKVDWISGACLLLRREAIDQVGLLDENYFMYSEDTDWCYRINRAGWDVVFLPEAKVIHFGGASAQLSNRGVFYDNTLTYDLYRSLFYYFKKFHGKFKASILRILVATSLFLRIMKWLLVFLIRKISCKELSYKIISCSKMLKFVLTSKI